MKMETIGVVFTIVMCSAVYFCWKKADHILVRWWCVERTSWSKINDL